MFLNQILRGIKARRFKKMDANGGFDQRRKISARCDRQNEFRNFQTEDFFFHHRDSEPVDFFEFAPFFQLDTDFNLASLADCRNAEQLADVDNSESMNFQIVLNQLGRFAFQFFADLFYQNRIVGNQIMTACYKVERALGFADTGISEYQNTDAEHAHQNAVQSHLRRQNFL